MTNETPISPSDPAVIIAGIRQFGLASDGSDLRDLERATEAEAGVAEARKVIAALVQPIAALAPEAVDWDTKDMGDLSKMF